MLRERQLHRVGRGVSERDGLRSRELRRMRRALSAMLRRQHVHGRGRRMLGRSLHPMRRRRGNLLQRQPMHRIEDDLPRPLPGLWDAWRTLLRGQCLRFWLL
jgi:hypothetical protein